MLRIFRRPTRTTLTVIALSVLVGVAAGVAAGAAIWSGSSAPVAITEAAAKTNFLWSIPTASGTLLGPNDDHLTLHLNGTRNYMTRFTDRPVRDAYVVANQDFARRFAGYFSGSNPNAVLTYTPPGDRLPVSIVLTIGNARWNPATPGWTFTATRIRKKTDNLPDTTLHIVPPVIPNPASFGHATLLIDDAGVLYAHDCAGSVTNYTWPSKGAAWDVTISQTSSSNLSTDTWNPAPGAGDIPGGIWQDSWESDGSTASIDTMGCSSDVNFSLRTPSGSTYPLEVTVADPATAPNPPGSQGVLSCSISGLPSGSPLKCISFAGSIDDGLNEVFDICSTDSKYAYGTVFTCSYLQQHP